MNLIFKFFILIGVSLTVAVSCKKDGEQLVYETEISRLTDSVLAANPSIPGIIVGVWDKEKNLDYTFGAGYSDPNAHEPMNPGYHFRIGSNTKSFVVTAVLQLVDEGKLSLTDKLSKFLPVFPRANEVNIKQLCTMESGIFDYSQTEFFAEQLLNNPLKKWTPDELIEIAGQNPYVFNPGAQYGYSNTNTVLLGKIAEGLTNKSLGTLLSERFFIPLGLDSTYFAIDNLMPANYLKGWGTSEYAPIPASSVPIDISEYYDMTWGWACGNNISTLQDVKTWVEKLVDGSMISDSLQQQRFTSNFTSKGFTYGYGMFTTGNGFWGHNGGVFGYSSVMMRLRGKDCTIVIGANTLNGVSVSAVMNLYLKIAGYLHP